MANVTKSYQGTGMLLRTGGSGPFSGQANLPFSKISPINPRNISYPGAVNTSSFASLSVRGKKSPGVSIATFVKPTWFTADLLNSLLGLPTLDANFDTDRFSIGIKHVVNGTAVVRVWDWSRCASISLYQTSAGGPVIMEMGFFSRWGETECPYGTTLLDNETLPSAPSFSIPSVSDAGPLTDISQVDFSSSTSGTAGTESMSQVRSWRLTLMRGQGFVYYADGTYYPKDISSAMFGGSLVIEQSPTSLIVPTTAANIRMSTQATTGSRFKMDLSLSLDSESLDHDLGFGNIVRTYTLLASGGGNPIALTAF